MRQLRARKGEEDEDDAEPDQQVAFERETGAAGFQLAPERTTDRQQPAAEGQQDERQDGQIVERIAAVPLEGAGVAIEVVLEVEAAEEGITLVKIDQDMPGQDDG